MIAKLEFCKEIHTFVIIVLESKSATDRETSYDETFPD